jgi:DNA-binding IclR family transcriptional regulator
MPDAERRRFLGEFKAGLSAARRRALETEIAEIRERGVAVEAFQSHPGWAAAAFPLRTGDDAAAGAIAIEGPVLKLGAKKHNPKHGSDWIELAASVAQMEALIQANPARFNNPYGHLDPADIRLPSVTPR